MKTITVVLKFYIEVMNTFLLILIFPSFEQYFGKRAAVFCFAHTRTALLTDRGPERAETCRRL